VHAIGEISAKDAAKFWRVDIRTARRRIKNLVDKRLIIKTSTSKNDPYGKYVVCQGFDKSTK
jgi:hypothetical protein